MDNVITPNKAFEVNTKGARVGIEVEVENVAIERCPKYWEIHGEAMLINGCEFVLKAPLADGELTKAMNLLYDKFTTEKFSQRCSTHIHVDIQDLSRVELFNFIALYVIFEPLLLNAIIAPERNGNVFCLPLEDAIEIENALVRCASKQDDLKRLRLGEYKYGAMNLASIGRLGSLEFRSLQGTGDKFVVKNWIEVLTSLKESAKIYKNPVEIMQVASADGAQALLEILPHKIEHKDSKQLVFRGVRNAQYFVFTGDWS